MPTKKHIIIFGVLCVVALGLGYWSGPFKKDSGQRAEVVAPTIVTNVVTNTLKEAVTNIVKVQPPVPEFNPIIEKAVRKAANKPTGELTKADLEKITHLNLSGKKLTDVKGLEKLTQLKTLTLSWNQLTDVKELEKLTQLTGLDFGGNQLTEVPKELEKLTQLTYLSLYNNQLTEVPKELEKLTKLTSLALNDNQLTDVKELEKLTQLELLFLTENPDLTKVQIDELKKALPNCRITSNFTK